MELPLQQQAGHSGGPWRLAFLVGAVDGLGGVTVIKMIGYVLLILLTSAVGVFVIGFVVGIVQSFRKEFGGQKQSVIEELPQEIEPTLRVFRPD